MSELNGRRSNPKQSIFKFKFRGNWRLERFCDNLRVSCGFSSQWESLWRGYLLRQIYGIWKWWAEKSKIPELTWTTTSEVHNSADNDEINKTDSTYPFRSKRKPRWENLRWQNTALYENLKRTLPFGSKMLAIRTRKNAITTKSKLTHLLMQIAIL